MTVDNFMYGLVDDTVSIPQDEYRTLLNDSRKLAALEQSGVENWEWYDLAMDIYNAFNE